MGRAFVSIDQTATYLQERIESIQKVLNGPYTQILDLCDIPMGSRGTLDITAKLVAAVQDIDVLK